MNTQNLKREYKLIKEKIDKADTVILYGASVILPIIRVALSGMEIGENIRIFDKGRFLDRGAAEIGSVVIILCGARKSTRDSMKVDALRYFPQGEIFDFWAIYYRWLIEVVHRDCDYESLAVTIDECRNERAIANIDSINTLFCNLRCKECSNGVQYRNNKFKIPVEMQIKNLKKITDILPILECNFQGGEVFTDVKFSDFILAHAQNPRIAIFSVATNASIFPDINCWESIKKIGAMIRISDYGELSKHKEKIIKQAKEWQIPCFVYPRAESWMKFGKYYKRGRTESELKEICTQCYFGTKDLMFIGDKLYCCLRTLFGNAIGEDNEAMRDNTLDLSVRFGRRELENIVYGRSLWEMCDYCDYPMKSIVPAEQL